MVATVAFVLIAGVADVGPTGEPSTIESWVKIVLGGLLVLLAVREWRGRPAAGEPPALPKWMTAIDTFTPTKATGLGLLLSAVNPKNLAMCVAAGVTIASGGLPVGQQVIAVAVFTVLAGSTVLVPVVGYALAAGRVREPLDRLRGWLELHNAAVMSVLLLVIGAVLVGRGFGGLF